MRNGLALYMFGSLALLASAARGEENLFPNPGFEAWNDKLNLPAQGQWLVINKEKQAGFEIFGLSKDEKHSGQSSLHMKDAKADDDNNFISLPLPGGDLRKCAGKALTFSIWVKQVSASAPKVVGIGISCKDAATGKTANVRQGLDSCGKTGWKELKVRMLAPKDLASVRLDINCAGGWRNTAEAFFDDASLTASDPDAIEAEDNSLDKPIPEPQNGQQKAAEPTTRTLAFCNPIPADWSAKAWGGFKIKAGSQTEKALTLLMEKQTDSFGGVSVGTEYLNFAYDLSAVPADKLKIRLKSTAATPILLTLRNGTEAKSVNGKAVASQADGKAFVEAKLSDFKFSGPLKNVNSLSMQFPEKLQAGSVELSEIAIVSESPAQPATHSRSEAAESYRASYEKEFSVASDPYARPEIKDGAWFVNGRPVFYLGPWIYNRTAEWSKGSNSLNIGHIAYNKPPSKEVFDALGFNSAQISAAHTGPGMALYGLGVSESFMKQEAEIKDYYEAFQDVPLVLDFAFGFNKAIASHDPEMATELQQRNGEWHEFIPLCPEHPDGDRYYRDYMRGGTIAALKNKANIFVYEIFNESSYNCQCAFSRRAFAEEMKRQFGSIKEANKAWGTVFANFGELAEVSNYQQHPKIWPDWCKHSARMYAEALKRYSGVIREVDKRPNIYFSEQFANGNLYSETGAGMDYRLIAGALDTIAIEGGWKYGSGGKTGTTDAMEAAASEGNTGYSFIADLAQSLVKGKKPVMNHEHYNGRFELGKRVPSKKEDMISSMWAEAMHGVSGSYHYCWDKRAWEWKTYEEAKQNVIKPSYKSYSTLNPYNWPPEELDGFKDFMKEIEPYRDIILPFPRTSEPSVAIFFSYPTLRMGYFSKDGFKRKMHSWYGATLHGHFPLKFVFEEDLAAGLPESIEALVAPCATYAEPGTLEAIEKFVKRGGTVIADQDAFSKDERGNAIPTPSFAIDRIDASDAKSPEALQAALLKSGARRVAALEGDDAKDFRGVDIQVADRGDFKLVFIFNVGGLGTSKGKLKLFINDKGGFYLTDIVNKRLLLPESGETWSAAALENGVELIVPPQERIVLTLERKRPADAKPFLKSQAEALLKSAQEKDAAHMKELKEEQGKLEAAAKAARVYEGVEAARCRSVDLRGAVNMGFKDDLADDRKGGWFDQGANDFEKMPLGSQTLAGVPFTIIDPARNGGRSALILYGKERDFFPKEAKGIALGGFAKNVYFLHTMGWGAAPGEPVLYYKVSYEDGDTASIAIRGDMEIGGWWGAPTLANAKIALESSNQKTGSINLQCFKWSNPNPGKKLKSLDIVSAQSGGVPAVVAITIEE